MLLSTIDSSTAKISIVIVFSLVSFSQTASATNFTYQMGWAQTKTKNERLKKLTAVSAEVRTEANATVPREPRSKKTDKRHVEACAQYVT